MNDPFENATSGLTSPATRHFAIAPDDSADLLDRPRAIYCHTAGDLAVSDGETTLVYALTQGEVLPIRAKRVLATGTTATVYGWL